MPNYSHGTKLTLASAEEPPYLTVGTDVSAKYKGAFCEAKIIDVNKHVKLRVLFDGSSGSYLINDTDLKQGSTLATGTRVEAKHPEKKKQQTYVQATISKILDHSRYTVVFDDGDQCILRRNSICLKSGKHFAESETLDQLPLTNPEHFGNPVKVGVVGSEHLSTNSSSHITTNSLTNHQQQQNNNTTTPKSQQTNNHLLLNDKPRGKSSSSTTNSSSTTSEDTKSNASETVTNNRKRRYNNQDSINDNTTKRLKKERSQNNTDKSTTTTATARRGSTKGGKRRESVNNGSKNAVDLDDNSLDSSIESGDVDPAETNVKYELIEVGVKLMVQYGKGKVQNFYEAKVNKIETNNAGKIRYFVHYTGWNNRYDEWITRNRIHSIVIEKENGAREGKTKHSETAVAPASNTTPISSNSSTTMPKLEPKEKEKDKIEEKKEKEKMEEKEKEKMEKEKMEEKKEKERMEEKKKEMERIEEKKKKEKEKMEEKKKEMERIEEKRKEKEREKMEEKKREMERMEEKKKEKEKMEEKKKEKERVEAKKEKERMEEKKKEMERMEEKREKQRMEEKEKEKEDSNSVNQHPPVANDSGPTYRFCDEIDESDCDKKISILQDRIMALRQTYTALKTELADLDRRKNQQIIISR